MKVLAINGSPRADGNTFTALNLVATELEKSGIKTDILHIGHKDIRGCIGCYKCIEKGECVLADDDFRGWTKMMSEADGLLLGSPVYFSSMAGTLKAFLDRAFFVNKSKMRHKVGASVAVARRAGGMPTFEQLNNYFLISEMLVAPSYYWNVIFGAAKGEVLKDAEGVATLQNLGRNMAWILQMKEQTKDTVTPPEKVQRTATNFIR